MTKTEQNRVLAWRLKVLREASAAPRNVAQTCRRTGFEPVTFGLCGRRYRYKHFKSITCDACRSRNQSIPVSHNWRRPFTFLHCARWRSWQSETDANLAAAELLCVDVLRHQGIAVGKSCRAEGIKKELPHIPWRHH